MTVAGLVLVGLVAAIHGYVFVLESLAWRSVRTRATFGIETDAQVEATRLLAFNQGFYNLFLAVGTAVGIALLLAGSAAAGYALVVAGAGSMAAAGMVLAASRPALLRPALVQLLPPALGLAALGLGALR